MSVRAETCEPPNKSSSRTTGVHYSGRPQVHTTYACGFTANKVYIKRSLNLSTVNTMCSYDFRKSQTSPPTPPPPPTPCPLPQLLFFISLSIFYGLTARERCEMVHEDSWWHIISVLIRSILFFSRYDLCNMWQM